MADQPLTGFDAAAARRHGIPDAAIAEFLSGQVGFDLTTARKDGVSDSQIVDFLAPPPTPKAQDPEPPKPAPESRGTWTSDLKSGFYGTSQAMAATSAVRAGEEIESLKKQIELFEKGDDPNVPERFRNALRSRKDQVPGLKRQLAEAEQRHARATAEEAKDAAALKALPVNEPLQRFTEGNLGELLKNPGAIARGLIGQSATAMVPLIVGTALGGPAGGAIAGGMVGVATGGGQEAVRVLQKHGVDATDPEAVRKALADPAIKAEIDKGFGIAQAIEGTVGAATGGLGGVTVPGKTVTSAIAKNVGLQAVGQGSLSAGGEAAKQGIIEGEFHPGKIAAAGLGEALFAPVDAAAAAFHNRGPQQQPRVPTPEEVARPVMETGTVDEAIAAARQVVERPAIEETAALTSEFGNRLEQDEAAILRLFGGLNDGVVERAPDGAWFYRTDEGKEWQLRPWDGVEREGTIPAALAAAQRAHYEQLGVKVVYFENDKAIPFDGAVDPQQPNTIFLSNDMSRNAAQVGAHEVGHLFESTVLPDGTNLGDLLHQQVAAGMTAEGRAYAERLFGPSAPKRDAFPEGPTGDSLHADAVTGHLIRELGADLGGEAPKFQTFMPRVLEAVEARYGIDAAKDVLQKLMAGIRQAMTTLRQFFFRADEGAEYGQPPTESQRWVSNLDEIHDTLARMYAERFGTQAEKENSKLRTMRETVLRDRAVRAMEQAPAAEAPPPAMPEGFLEGLPEGRPGPAPGPAYTDALQKVRQYQRWLVELDQKRRTDAETSPQAYLLRQTEQAILNKVKGVEGRLTKVAAERLAKVRADLAALLDPQGDSPDMARVRAALAQEQQRMADAAAVGTPSPGMERALAETPATVAETPQAEVRGRAVMPEAAPVQPALAAVETPESAAPTPAIAEPAPVAQPAAPVVAAPAPAAPAPDPNSFAERLKAEREAVWADRSIMGRVQRNIARDEQFATDVARERIMREDAAPLIRRALEEDGIPDTAIPEIARLYRQEDGEAVEVAFDRAVDRWATKREAEGALFEQDLYDFDWLKQDSGGDAILAEALQRIEEAHSGREREKPGDADIPLGSDDPRAASPRPGEAAARDEQAGSGEDRGGPRGRGDVAGEEGAALSPRTDSLSRTASWVIRHKQTGAVIMETFDPKKVEALNTKVYEAVPVQQHLAEVNRKSRGDEPSFSPRERPDALVRPSERSQTQALLDAPEASREQGRRQKEEAELRMRGKQTATKPQQSAGDLPMFGGDLFEEGQKKAKDTRQQTLFSPRAPEQADLARQIADARAETNTEPTEGQKEAGNYAKGRVTFHGLPFVMENPEGSIRRGVDAKGKAWEAKLPADYGYLSRTEGADGDHVDAYIGPDLDSQRAWVIDQIDPKTGKFDEHKIVMGVADWNAARDIYERAFSDGSGPERMGNAAQMTLDELKAWLADGDTTKPIVFSPRIAAAGRDNQKNAARLFGEGQEAANYTPEERAALARIGAAEESTTLREKLANARKAGIGTAIIKAVVDPYAGLRALSPEAYVTARNANDVSGAVKWFMEGGTLKINGSTYDVKDKTGGVVWDVIAPLSNRETGKTEAIRFIRWMIANRAEGLKAEGRENLFSAEDIATLKGLNRGTLDFDYTMSNGKTTRSREAAFLDTQKKYNEYNKNVLDLARDNGWISAEAHAKFIDNPFYVPMFRVSDTEGRVSFPASGDAMARQTAFQKLKGGSEKLNADLWNNAMENWTHMISGSLKNKAGREILGVAEKAGAARKVSAKEYDHEMSKAQKESTTWVMENGEKQYYEVTDKGVFSALQGMHAADIGGKPMAFLQGFRRIYQYGVTSNPWFAVQTLAKDLIHTPAVTKLPLNVPGNFKRGVSGLDVATPFNNLARAIAARDLKAPEWTEEEGRLMAGGGLMSRTTFNESGVHGTRLGLFLNTPDKLRKAVGWISAIDAAHRQVQAVGEGISRMALYKKLTDEGVPHDIAAFEAKDIQDYSLRPGNPYVRAYVNLLPFANVHNIGLYKVARGSKDADMAIAGDLAKGMAKGIAWGATKKLAMVMGAMTALVVANDAFYQDDPDYQKRTELDRNTNFWFKLGGKEIRIPMGFEVAALARASANFIGVGFDKEMTLERAGKNVLKIAAHNLAMNPIPQPVRPAFDVWANSRATGGPIENSGDQRLEPNQRYSAQSTLIARGASNALDAVGIGLSPKKLDYLVQAYGAWLGTQSLGLADTMVRAVSNEPVRPEGDIWASLTNGRVRADTPAQSRYVDALYEQGEAISQAYNTYRELLKRGRPEEAKAHLEDNRDKILKHRTFERVKRIEGDLNEQIKSIENSALSAEQKRIRIMQLREMKNRAARQVFAPEARP